jgi:hypothetical protein
MSYINRGSLHLLGVKLPLNICRAFSNFIKENDREEFLVKSLTLEDNNLDDESLGCVLQGLAH